MDVGSIPSPLVCLDVLGTRVELRAATVGDAELIFEWRNHPEIIALSTSQRVVPWAEHAAWWASTLADPSSLILVVSVDGQPAGQVRFLPEGARASAVSIYLMPPHVGRRLGTPVLTAACAYAFARLPIDRVLAFVRSDNIRSLGAFRKAGFVEYAASSCPDGHEALALERTA